MVDLLFLSKENSAASDGAKASQKLPYSIAALAFV
jgi:hypothetical protein